MAAEVERNLQKIRQNNLIGKREVQGKPPAAIRKPPVEKVILIYSI